jgi:glutathione S-transferase
MIRLCGFRVSNYHNKVRLALMEKGVAFEEDAACRPSRDDDFLALSPMGKVPFLKLDGTSLAESQVICEYLEDAWPEKPLYPKAPLERARVRELICIMELHVELVARRLYGEVFFGRPGSAQVRESVRNELERGVRAFRARASFAPYVAGAELTLADCAAFAHLPVVSLATRLAFGRDVLEDLAQVRPYLDMLGERPAFRRVNQERKAAQAAMIGK